MHYDKWRKEDKLLLIFHYPLYWKIKIYIQGALFGCTKSKANHVNLIGDELNIFPLMFHVLMSVLPYHVHFLYKLF